MKPLPEGVRPARRTATFTEETLPKGLTQVHTTKDGTWARIVVLDGRLRYDILEPLESHDLEPGVDGIVEPAVEHRVTPHGAVRFFVEFLR